GPLCWTKTPSFMPESGLHVKGEGMPLMQVLAALLIVWAIILADCNQSSVGSIPTPAAKTLKDVRVTIASRGTGFVYFAVGQEKGFYYDEGLNVILETAAPITGIQAMIAGQYQFSGNGGSGQTAAAQNAPVKIVAVFQSRPAYGFYAQP